MRFFSDRSSFAAPALLGFLAAVVLGLVLFFGVPQARAYYGALVRGETAYGWLASPVTDGSTETRAAALERLLAAEVGK